MDFRKFRAALAYKCLKSLRLTLLFNVFFSLTPRFSHGLDLQIDRHVMHVCFLLVFDPMRVKDDVNDT